MKAAAAGVWTSQARLHWGKCNLIFEDCVGFYTPLRSANVRIRYRSVTNYSFSRSQPAMGHSHTSQFLFSHRILSAPSDPACSAICTALWGIYLLAPSITPRLESLGTFRPRADAVTCSRGWESRSFTPSAALRWRWGLFSHSRLIAVSAYWPPLFISSCRLSWTYFPRRVRWH